MLSHTKSAMAIDDVRRSDLPSIGLSLDVPDIAISFKAYLDMDVALTLSCLVAKSKLFSMQKGPGM